MISRRDYYPIAEAAAATGCSQDELVHLAAIGKLVIWSMIDQVASVNSLPLTDSIPGFPGIPDFGAEWISGEAGEFITPADFIRLPASYFRQIEAGVQNPDMGGFEVEGSEGEVHFFGPAQEQPGVRHFLKHEDVEKFRSASARHVPEVRRKRAALISELQDLWPDIESDLRHADENGLKHAAKLPKHGIWNLAAAVTWAEERGKLSHKSTTQTLDPLEALNRLTLTKKRS